MRDDLQLIRGVLRGRAEDFGELVDRYQMSLDAFVVDQLGDRAAADEVVRTVFFRAYRALRTFRGDASFAAWLQEMAVRECREQRADEERGTARSGSSAADAAARAEAMRDAIVAEVAADLERQAAATRGMDPRMLAPVAVALCIAVAGVLSLRAPGEGGLPARAGLLVAAHESGMRAALAGFVGLPGFASVAGAATAVPPETNERARTLLVLRIAEALELPDEKARQISDIFARTSELRRQLATQREQVDAGLRAALASGEKARIGELLAQAREIDRELLLSPLAGVEQIGAVLTIEQRARLTLLLSEIRGQLEQAERGASR